MATRTNSAKLAMSEHLPNRHVTVCRPGLHQSLQQLSLDLQLVKSEIDRQDSRLSSTQHKLLGYSMAGKEVLSVQIAESPKQEPQKSESRVVLSSLVVMRTPNQTSELLRSIGDKYAKRASDITAREDAVRLSTLRSLRASLAAQTSPGKTLRPLHESSLYIHHYC